MHRTGRQGILGRWLFLLAMAITLIGTACGYGTDSEVPAWLQSVDPEPGATAAVPDAVAANHSIQGPDQDIRLVVDGTDVTTYASFEAGKVRYESGVGPVVLGAGRHTAEVQLVELANSGASTRFWTPSLGLSHRLRWDRRVLVSPTGLAAF
jgi:hypothetical protein